MWPCEPDISPAPTPELSKRSWRIDGTTPTIVNAIVAVSLSRTGIRTDAPDRIGAAKGYSARAARRPTAVCAAGWLILRLRERAASKDRHVERFEIAGADDVEFRTELPRIAGNRYIAPLGHLAERHGRREACTLDAGHRTHRFEHARVCRTPLRFRVAGEARIHPEHQLMIQREAGIRCGGFDGSANEQPARGDERKRNRKLADDERRDRCRSSAKRASVRLESPCTIGLDSAHAGPSAKTIVLNIVRPAAAMNIRGDGMTTTSMPSGSVPASDAPSAFVAHQARTRPADRADRRQNETFDEQLADDPRPSAPECLANGDLTAPRGAAREQQIREVQTHHDEHERGHPAEQQGNRGGARNRSAAWS